MSNVEIAKKHLSKHKLRNTPVRTEVFTILKKSDAALSNHDIEQKMADNVDRVTLYRTLQKFLEHGVVHQIEDGGQLFYALCSNCEIHNHQDNHLHFKCTNCDTIQCLHQSNKIEFSLPKGYQINSMKILLEGKCASCSAS